MQPKIHHELLAAELFRYYYMAAMNSPEPDGTMDMVQTRTFELGAVGAVNSMFDVFEF